MAYNSQFLDASGNLNREAVRAHFLRVGKLDGIKKGDEVWISDMGFWTKAKCVRAVAGGCWIVKLNVSMIGLSKTVLTVENFGGKCAWAGIACGLKLAPTRYHQLDLFP